MRPYPCLGQWSFLRSKLSQAASYEPLLASVKDGATILDLACCLGQELHYLAAKGAASDRMYGSDLVPEFWELGSELFCDRDKFHAKFYQADIFDRAAPIFSELQGSLDFVWIGAFMHLFDWRGQLDAVQTIIKMTRPGATVIGAQIGVVEAAETPASWKGETRTTFNHNEDSMEKLWKEGGEATGTTWKTTATLVKVESGWRGKDAHSLKFEVARLA